MSQLSATQNLKLAEKGAWLSIIVYIILSAIKLAGGRYFQSDALTADAYNNISDIIGNIAVLLGLRLARRPADREHTFGHWKIEDLASLITSFIMFTVGIGALQATIIKFFGESTPPIDLLGAVVGLLSAVVLFAVFLYNRRLSKKVQSKGLMASAKDNLADAVTSLGTSIAIIADSVGFPIVDKIVAIIITIFIFKTAYEIFMESFFTLSDGFDQNLLTHYEAAILAIPQIVEVKSQRGRTYGANIYLDVVITMNPNMSVYDSHAITEQVEDLLKTKHGVYDVDIHVEPAALTIDE